MFFIIQKLAHSFDPLQAFTFRKVQSPSANFRLRRLLSHFSFRSTCCSIIKSSTISYFAFFRYHVAYFVFFQISRSIFCIFSDITWHIALDARERQKTWSRSGWLRIKLCDCFYLVLWCFQVIHVFLDYYDKPIYKKLNPLMRTFTKW